jgi:hypothetical protein
MTTTNSNPEHSAPQKGPTSQGGEGGLTPQVVTVAVIGLLMAVGAAFVWGSRMAFSVGVGAAFATSNLYLLAKIVGRVMGGAGASGAGAWSIIAVTKMAVLLGGGWLLLTRGWVDPIGLCAGYGSLPIGIALSPLLSDNTRPG